MWPCITIYYDFVCLPQEPEEQLGACQGPRGRITQYQIRFQVGSTVLTAVNVNISACTTERCSNTFNLSDVPSARIPSSYDSVSVAAINAVGVGAARTCTSQSISKLNYLDASFSGAFGLDLMMLHIADKITEVYYIIDPWKYQCEAVKFSASFCHQKNNLPPC